MLRIDSKILEVCLYLHQPIPSQTNYFSSTIGHNMLYITSILLRGSREFYQILDTLELFPNWV